VSQTVEGVQGVQKMTRRFSGKGLSVEAVAVFGEHGEAHVYGRGQMTASTRTGSMQAGSAVLLV